MAWQGAGKAARAQGIAVILIMLWGVWQGIAALSAPESVAKLRDAMTPAAFLGGRTAATVNDVMAHALPADYALRAAGGALRWGVFGSGGPQLRLGCENWLFLTEELRPWPDAAQAMAERAAGLGRITARLREAGIPLIIAITPDKARVYPEQLCGAPYAAQAQARHAEFTALLRAHDVHPLDLLAVLRDGKAGGETYWRTDTHWSQRGAALAAAEIARAGATVAIPRDQPFRTVQATAETDGPGDLVRLMSLERLPSWLRPQPDRHHLAQTPDVEIPAAGLLDDAPVAPVVLLGSSYSVNANFHGALQQALQARVANFGRAGAGFAGSAREYFASLAWRETPPKLVVWEVLERALAQPLSDEERAFLNGW